MEFYSYKEDIFFLIFKYAIIHFSQNLSLGSTLHYQFCALMLSVSLLFLLASSCSLFLTYRKCTRYKEKYDPNHNNRFGLNKKSVIRRDSFKRIFLDMSGFYLFTTLYDFTFLPSVTFNIYIPCGSDLKSFPFFSNTPSTEYI